MLNFGGDIINIYLAGCISSYYNENEYYKATQWRKNAIKALSDKNVLIGENKFTWFDPTVNFTINVSTTQSKAVLQQNKFYLNKSDILLVNLDRLSDSSGTIYEIIYAGIKDKPIIAFGNDKLFHAPHISENITVRFDNLDNALQCIFDYFIQ